MADLKTDWQAGDDWTAAVANDVAGRINTLQATAPVVVAVPASASATGTPGSIAYSSSYLYVCVATDTWVRAALGTWA